MTNDIAKQDTQEKYTPAEISLVHNMYAKNSTEEEFKLFLYTANKFGLDPLLKQIWCVKFLKKDNTGKVIGAEPAQIYAGRDGFLEIAHRSGQFNGLESGMKDKDTAYAKVYRKDMEHPFYVEVALSEYSTNQALWKTKPKTMLIKVAESQALRRAFSISGIYSPEEMGQWELEAQGINFNKPQAIQSSPQQTYQQSNTDFDWSKLDLEKEPNKKWNDKTKKYDVPMVKRLWAIKGKLGISNEDFQAKCIEITGKEHSKDWIIKDCMLIDLWLKEVETGEDDEPVDTEISDIDNAPEDDLKEITEQFDKQDNMQTYMEQTLNATETARSIADRKVKEATK